MNNIANEILSLHGVRPTEDIDFEVEVRARVDHLKDYIRKSGARGYVLGISGGVDSTTAGRMCQIACSELRAEKIDAVFTAVRLPSYKQADEADALVAIEFIDPDQMVTINIGEATDAIHNQMQCFSGNATTFDFHKGNTKARMRMLAQYEIAGITGSLVVGTDHNSELVPAFYTKWGDQACDITVLNGLNKRQVRKMAEALGAPESLFKKVPTADLEELDVGKPDEVALGFSYDDLDDFLEGKQVDPSVVEKICAKYEATRHKRNWPVAFSG
jgi:NAD+ synthase